MNLVFQWSNTNLKTKPKPLVLFASQNNAPTFLGRKSVLTSMIHRASRPQAEDSGFPPHTRGPREGDLLPTVPSEGCLQLLCRRELERPSVTSSGSRCSPEEREQRTQVLRSSQEIYGLTLRGGTRHGGARRRGWGRIRRHTPTPLINETRPLHNADWPFPATVKHLLLEGGTARSGIACDYFRH